MKRLLFMALISFCLIAVHAQDDSYIMYETMNIKPKNDKIEAFNAALAVHNKKFHASGAEGVRIFYIVNGPYEGQYKWVMGPLTYTDLDSRPDDKAHTDDWNKVMINVADASKLEYWKRSKELTYEPEGSEKFEKRLVRRFDVKTGHGKEFEELLERILEVTKEQALPYSMNVYWNEFETGDGADVAVVYGFDKYSLFDKDMGFVKAFEEVHGENSWMNTYKRMVDNTNGLVEELWELVPELGGM